MRLVWEIILTVFSLFHYNFKEIRLGDKVCFDLTFCDFRGVGPVDSSILLHHPLGNMTCEIDLWIHAYA
ncbi:hypothetical protein EPI10_016390 [Gossypium australe]|uniref:Uncharacterized protein n=1 Tax=Gossypium australe TaxID=47621 RepID=A0A5B6VNG1_9ROSI|nr:hypothetical protein EPI10_016390 [Gossypium australe]